MKRFTLPSLALLLCIPTTACLADTPNAPAAGTPANAERPVTIRVVDAKTGKPITRFGYTFTVESNGVTREYTRTLDNPIVAESGEFTLPAGHAALLRGRAFGGAILGGYHSWKELKLAKTNTGRRLELAMETGMRTTGRITDSATGKPIAGVSVAPSIFCPPDFCPDRDRAVTTDADGRYTLDGVDPQLGLEVAHADYETTHERHDENEPKPRMNFTMRLLPALRGRVVTTEGKPLADVQLVTSHGRCAVTDATGAFTLRTALPDAPTHQPSNNEPTAENTLRTILSHPGYFRTEAVLHPDPAQHQTFVLKPIPMLTGRVVDAQGKPVTGCTIITGEGECPSDYDCATTEVRAADGAFRAPLGGNYADGKSSMFCAYAWAPGYATTQLRIPATDTAAPRIIRLERGITQTVTVRAPGPIRDGTLMLIPEPALASRDNTTSGGTDFPRIKLGARTAALDTITTITGLSPGAYLLVARTAGLSPEIRTVTITENPAPLAITLSRTGRISGKIAKVGNRVEAASFAKGEVRWSRVNLSQVQEDLTDIKPIAFITDEQGAFAVENVPAGDVVMNFHFKISADILGSDSYAVRVRPGQTTDLAAAKSAAVLQFQIGDGSVAHRNAAIGGVPADEGKSGLEVVDNVTTREPMVLVRLTPLDDEPGMIPGTDWATLQADGTCTIEPLQPGRYRLSVFDWQGSRGRDDALIVDKEIRVETGRTVVPLRLGGASVFGRTQHADGRAVYPACITATGTKTGTIRRAWTDEDGEYILRYLPADTYTLGRTIPDQPDSTVPLGTATTRAGQITPMNPTAAR